ncbi:MAG TPA: murein transglycosylase [Cyanobacteria bacterium UBA11149]|nr:murein transglycosylase [Cyanobacteria bacterium UBA11367]HBE57056.1 murein transglycosylase [Cyanobacteria bacterium UBA11366]HBK64914.1 murein transglycosylase [Cyanobacteria bacterium UBA11166]HBR74351.1 murein transglycosylase [Cyanobacteria bacterium UBA11159]HBS68703.1 murein transglycosylase [Cyanobacteria bacterium UBA11153]HBW88904.1 murein transglycosylase [Cyanobacteria bacterium UBA11149]HCA93301.1 murein transglycosylase [Cyanobacteria bacterium UBA9226]
MRKLITWLSLSLGWVIFAPGIWTFLNNSVQSVKGDREQIAVAQQPVNPTPEQPLPLQLINSNNGEFSLESLGIDEQLWDRPGKPGDKQALLASIDNSLRYLRTSKAAQAYQNYQIPGITLNRVRRSLVRFRQIVVAAKSAEELQVAVNREFIFYKSIGRNNQGSVLFTGYFEPIYLASRTPSAEYRYPLYRIPPNLNQWPKPHLTRLELEGADGLGTNSPLRGLEFVWLRDRFEAFLVHVQGSAQLKLTDGSVMTVGFAGKTDLPYSSVGRAMIDDGKFTPEQLTMPVMIDYFKQFPEEMNRYLQRNESFIFFKETNGAPPMGSIGVPVTAERSIATDKSLMPPGALALIKAPIPYPNADGKQESQLVSRYVLDQDTGSAIKGPGRVDIFMGTGVVAGERAGIIKANGELYYLLLKK